jgi:hypothetical protein
MHNAQCDDERCLCLHVGHYTTFFPLSFQFDFDFTFAIWDNYNVVRRGFTTLDGKTIM